MNKALLSKSTAKKLIVGGAVGFGIGTVLSLMIVLPLYGKVGKCIGTDACGNTSFTTETIEARLTSALMIGSLVAILLGASIIAIQIIQGHRFQVSISTKSLKRTAVKTLALAAAFFVSTFALTMVVSGLISVLFPGRSPNQRGHLFAYVMLALYPLVGGAAVYATNRYLRRK